jgi:PAS domain S-box-containing protein/putative nucleotidyltransferase with HDIG domain
MAGRVGKKGAANSEVKPARKKGGAARAVMSRAVTEQPEAKRRIVKSVGKTDSLQKPGTGKLVHELQVRQAELETQNEGLRRAQQQSQASQERYFDLYDIAPVGYFSISEKGIILEVNITGANLLGSVPGDMRAQRFFNFIFEEDLDIYYQHRSQLFETMLPQACEMRMVRKDGALVWVLVEAIVAKDARSGKPVCLATMSDVTRQKKAEEALRESEQKYHLLADNTVDGIWLLDMNLKLIYCSPSSQKQSGFTLQEIMQMPLEQYFTPESLKVVAESFLEEIPKAEADPDYNPIITLDLEFYKKDGTAFWAESKFSVVRDNCGKPVSILGVARDITERRQAEEALRESEALYRLVADHTTDTVWLMDPNLKVIYHSPSAEKLRGYTSQEIVELPLEQHVTPESLKLVYAVFLEELARVEADPDYNPVRTFDVELYSKDGSTVWRETKLSVIRDPSGKLVSFLGEARDITERRRAEEALRASESQYRLLAEHMTDVVLLLDMNLKFIYVSPSVEKMRGFTSLEAMELPLEKHLTPESLKLAAELFLEEIPGTQADPGYNPVPILDLEYYCKDGTTRWGEGKFSIIRDSSGKPVSILGEVRDITERKQADDALKASEAQYRLLSEHITDTVWLMDMNLLTTYQSPSVQRVRGFTLQEIEEMPLEKHLTPESLKIATAVFLEEMAKIEADPAYNFTRTLELEFYRKNGAIFWSENTFSLIRDENGRPLSILGEGRDITDRKHSEEALQRSEAQYRLLSEHMTDTIRLMDMDLKTVYLSPSAEKQRGFTHQEILELPLDKQLTPESLRLAIEIFSEEIPRVKADPDHNPIHILDLEYICKDGTTVWAESKFSVIRDENGKPVSILAEARDITERRLAEDKLAKSYASLKKTLDDAINTMVKIVELRDPYTAGHQQKVAELATAIAREMKLEDSRIEQLRMAAVTHDIGKMYVPSDILSKPGRLSNIEFGLIKTHSQSGYAIVKGMDFPCSVADAVLQHHERLDGSGYPGGLKGEDTILEAKILAVADVIEAMASHRPYRPALGIDKALEEISENKGSLYDPDVVDACLELFNSGKFEFKPV